VLLEQLEKGLSSDHKVKKLGLSESGKPFSGYDVLISTNLRSRDFLMKAIKDCDLMIIDEAHRVSPNGQAYKELLDQFDNFSKEESKILGLTASPERRTGDQKDQLGLAFDAIIDCADIEELIKENVLVAADYKSFFIHDLDLDKMDISTGDFPVEQLSNAIIKSSMIDYACEIYKEQKKEFNKNFEDTETITKINVEQNNKTGDYSSSNTSQQSQNKSKSVKQEETTFPQFSLNVSNPISWKLMLLIMVMQLLTNIMLVVVLYLK
jgi:superfamily II DNA or RNA helicase